VTTDNDALKELLQTIRTEMADPDKVDLEAQDLLMVLHDDIEVLLDLSSEAQQTDKAPVAEAASTFVERFEVDHPALTRVMNRVLNLLAGSGV
jgi:hypothetical protein